jgi:anaerobic selenocysteine-containing dehydrogenase/Fe-S-cluster-containing dehydrogenase component
MADRREFLKVLGVTGAGATLSGCSTNPEKLIPYVVPPEDIVPGVSTWYRTTCRECPAGCGMSVRTREGRAVKVEGNPLSPISHGRLCARGQASLHGLYDPDRIPQPLVRNGEAWSQTTWDDAERRLLAGLQQNRGHTVFLTHNFTGTLDRLIDEFATTMGIERLRYDTYGWEPLRAASRMVFGVDGVPVHDFANADLVVTFGADFLETWVSPVDYHHGFVQAHAYNQGRRGKLIAVSPWQSLTDMNADEWLNARPGTEHLVALAMARIIVDERGGQAAGASAELLRTITPGLASQLSGVSPERLRAAALDFVRNGRSLAVGPGVASTHRSGTAVAVAVAILNSVAGNLGRTVRVGQQEAHATQLATYRDLQNLINRMRNVQVTALLVYGPNPVHTMPETAAVKDGLSKLNFLASFSTLLDETSQRAHLLLPDHHALESWGDYVPRTGLRALIQPVMTPVFNTKQTADVLISVASQARTPLRTTGSTYYEYLRGVWGAEVLTGAAAAGAGVAGGFDDRWRDALKAGFVTSGGGAGGAAPAPATAAPALAPFTPPTITAPPAQTPSIRTLRFDQAAAFTGDGEFHLVVYPSTRFWDGRHANKPWMQELPDPINKFTWVSCAELSPAAAERLGVDTGHIVRVRTAAGEVELPAWIHPGMREDVVAIQIGQGHEGMGRYARERGVNPIRLLQPEVDPTSGSLVWCQAKAHVESTGRWVRPPQHAINDDQEDRHIAVAVSLSGAREADISRGLLTGPPGAEHGPAQHEAAEGGHGEVHPQDAIVYQLQAAGGMLPSKINATPQGYPHVGHFWGEYTEDAPRWGMAIDLERCTGCSACVTACYAENNIAVVGPDQVAMGRIMQWIRIERYFDRGEDGELHQTHFLPMICQHCGNAPCEPVCPVFAAYHTPDGLNAQVYNRCVGTRYCANNCPYKVRVFNWFSAEWPEPLNWQLNPDVTVREKGVMEKCSLCVQRIREAQNYARIEERAVTDGEIVPACAQTCPGDALVFGNVADPNSRVSRIAASGRGYRVLEAINTQSAITYLKKVVLDAEA